MTNPEIAEAIKPFISSADVLHFYRTPEGEISSSSTEDYERAERHEVFVTHEQMEALNAVYRAITS